MEQSELLARLVETLEDLGIPYMIGGSYASSAWGEARFTQDIDVVVALDSGHIDGLKRYVGFTVMPITLAGRVGTLDRFLAIEQWKSPTSLLPATASENTLE